MSLIDSMMEDCCLVEKTRVSDGAGGFTTTYTDGVHFNAAITLDSSIEAMVAQKQGVSSAYTITTKKATILDYHDIVKRTSDSRQFRVTSDGVDKFTPNTAGLDIRQVTAEKWEGTNP